MIDKVLTALQKWRKGRFEKKVTFTLIITGTGIAISPFIPGIWDVIILLLNKVIDVQFDEVTSTNNYAYKTFAVIIGLSFVLIGLWFYFKTKEKVKKLNILQIRHSSIEATGYSEISKDLSDYNVETYPVDQVKELNVLNEENLQHALRVQSKEVERILNRLNTSGEDEFEIAYLGLAHIPLVALMGYQLADKLTPSFFEWDADKSKWFSIDKSDKKYPPLLLRRDDLVQSIEDTEEVIIKVEVTYPIDDRDIDELNLGALNAYSLHLASPHRKAVLSLEQLQDYKEKFRDLLDEINKKYPNLKRINLFYSGQPSLNFVLNSAISPRMDAEVWVFNHVKKATPKYKWAIKLTKNGEPNKIKIIEEELVKNV